MAAGCAVATAGLLFLPGCSRAPTAVQGSVTLDGAPLDEAAILFVPLEHGRAKTGVAIADGRYTLPADDGLLPGKYRVEIVDNPPLKSAESATAATLAKSPAPARRRLPPEYTHHSPLSIDVPAAGAQGAITADYKLKSNP